MPSFHLLSSTYTYETVTVPTFCPPFIIYFLCYQGVLSHVIYYHEQHHLFLFSKEYFLKQIHTEGLLSYLTDFIIQFFYMPALGSAILAGILAGIYLLTHYNIKK